MTMILTNPRERTRFFRFTVVGVIGAIVDFGTFNLLTTVMSIPGVIAQIFSFTAAVISNFLWNRYWTYPDSRSKPVSRQVLEFALISLIGLAIRTPLFAFLETPLMHLFEGMHLQTSGAINARFLAHNAALAFAIIVVMFWNFFVNRFFTYGDVE